VERYIVIRRNLSWLSISEYIKDPVPSQISRSFLQYQTMHPLAAVTYEGYGYGSIYYTENVIVSK